MSENFLYSEAITTAGTDGTITDTYTNMVSAEDLNNIAVDLGVAKYSHFPLDTSLSAVSCLNQITADLTSSGILHSGDNCSVSISGENITIGTGICVFESGAKKRLENPVTVEFIPNGTNYLYMIHNDSDNRIELINSLVEPIDGDYVLLAEITDDKNVINRKHWSLSKTTRGVNSVERIKCDFLFTTNYDEIGGDGYVDNTHNYEFDISNGANYLILDWSYVNKSSLSAIKLDNNVEKTLRYDYEHIMRVKRVDGTVYIATNHRSTVHKLSNVRTDKESIELWFV